MAGEYRPDVSNWMMDAGGYLADTLPFRSLAHLITDSSSKYYRETRMPRAEKIIPVTSKAELPEVEADTDTNLIDAIFRKLLSKVVVLGANKDELQEIKEHVGGSLGLAFRYKDVTRAGVLSYFPTSSPPSNPEIILAGLREGPNNTEAGIVVVAKNRDVYIPESGTVVKQHVPIADLPKEEFPSLRFS